MRCFNTKFNAKSQRRRIAVPLRVYLHLNLHIYRVAEGIIILRNVHAPKNHSLPMWYGRSLSLSRKKKKKRYRGKRVNSRRNLFDACVIAPVSSRWRRNTCREKERESARQGDSKRARKGSGGRERSGRDNDLACTKSTKLNFGPLAHAIYEPWYILAGKGREVLSNGV